MYSENQKTYLTIRCSSFEDFKWENQGDLQENFICYSYNDPRRHRTQVERLLNVLCTFNLRLMPTRVLAQFSSFLVSEYILRYTIIVQYHKSLMLKVMSTLHSKSNET